NWPRWGSFLLVHLAIQAGHRHFTDNVVGMRLIAAVDDVAFLLVSKDCRSSLVAISPIEIDVGAVQNRQRLLNLADMVSLGPDRNMSGVGHGSRLEFRVAMEKF